MTFSDAVQSAKTLLSSNWNNGNTDLITPSFYENYSVKRVLDMNMKSAITIYALPTTQKTNALGGTTRETRTPVTIDIITKVSRAHSIKLLKEVDRIVGLHLLNPDSNYDILDPDGTTWRDFSDAYKLIFRWVYDISLIKTNESRI
jgi:hypothetical protein